MEACRLLKASPGLLGATSWELTNLFMPLIAPGDPGDEMAAKSVREMHSNQHLLPSLSRAAMDPMAPVNPSGDTQSAARPVLLGSLPVPQAEAASEVLLDAAALCNPREMLMMALEGFAYFKVSQP